MYFGVQLRSKFQSFLIFFWSVALQLITAENLYDRFV